MIKDEDIKLPDYENTEPFNKVIKTGTKDGVFYLGGRGETPSDIMFVSSCPLMEECEKDHAPPSKMKGPAGALLMRQASKAGLDPRKCYFTSLVKHMVPKKHKLKPTAEMIHWFAESFEKEIQKVKPKIIVCMGKEPFSYLFSCNFSLKEILGGIFHDQERDIYLYVMNPEVQALLKPELTEQMYVDLKEVKRFYDEIRGIQVNKVPLNYTYIDTKEQLQTFVDDITGKNGQEELAKLGLESKPDVLSVDCEWKGSNFVSGTLRYAQFAWKPGYGMRIKFLDHNSEYTMDASLEEVGKLLEPLTGGDTKYIGHQISADAHWLKHHLGIDISRRIIWDTLYAEHALDESADLKLERLALKYTDLGRYDIPLLVEKKKLKIKKEEGYDRIPDDVLGPYSIKDVDTVIRAYPYQLQKLVAEKQYEHFMKVRLPFVTYGFITMTETGLPCDLAIVDQMTESYNFLRVSLEGMFIDELEKEAFQLLVSKLSKLKPAETATFIPSVVQCKNGDLEEKDLFFKAKQIYKKDFIELKPLFDHYLSVRSFNHKSADHLRRWLFGVKGYTPLVATGKPAVAWDKIEKMEPHKRKDYNPSTDKDTLKVLSEQHSDKLLLLLRELKKITSVTTQFLKEDKTGLHKYVNSNGRVHTNLQLTETGRPRSWAPNILNSNKFLDKQINEAVARVHKYYQIIYREKFEFSKKEYGSVDHGLIREYKEISRKIKNIKPMRYNYKAEEGYVFTESDYATAEVVALGYVSGDYNLISVVSEYDKQFGLVKKSGEWKPVRVCYNSNTNITEDKQDASLLYTADSPDLKRDENGNIVHPKRDVHWELVEDRNFNNKPRELMDKDTDRGAGKVGNFQMPYGATEGLMERTIEIATGIKPPEGTGKKIQTAYHTKYPVANEFLSEMELIPETDGVYRSPITGAVRHFHTNMDLEGVSKYTRNSILAPLKREARNFPIQNIVAETLARAVVWLNRYYEDNNMKSRVVVPLYDACYTYGPLEERFKVKEAHERFMAKENTWKTPGGILEFDVDTEFTLHWSIPLSGKTKEQIYDPTYRVAA